MISRATSAAPATLPGAPVPLRSPSSIELPREICTLYPRASRLEWLLTNGTGGFAMGTVAGSNTRPYHGLLVASLHPPVERVVTLARLEETVLTTGGDVPLSVNQYPNTLYPDGWTRLVRFALEDGPVWTWSVGGVEVESGAVRRVGALGRPLSHAGEDHAEQFVDAVDGEGGVDGRWFGADGLLVEVHPNPAEALSDGQQQVDFEVFRHLVPELLPFLNAAERKLV